jgi:hypothetical protein
VVLDCSKFTFLKKALHKQFLARHAIANRIQKCRNLALDGNISMQVNGLKLPELFRELLRAGKWVNPGDHIVSNVIPFLHDPVDFLPSLSSIERESKGSMADDPEMAILFHEYRGSKNGEVKPLPWRDVELSVLIAVCRYAGDDSAIALDYRSDPLDPRVIASDWSDGDSGHLWRLARPRFSKFIEDLGIT